MLEPNQKVATEEFYEAAMQPDFPDEIALQLDRADPETTPLGTFSQEGVDALAEQFRMFVMARIVGRGEAVGALPRHLRAMVTLDWDPRRDVVNDPNVGPFFHIDNDRGLEPLDHTRRHVWRS